ncbi:MAG: L,D-transpeptidase family protein [Ferruginibacter sp.]
MHYHKRPACYLPFLVLIFLIACNNHRDTKKDKELVANPESIDEVIQKNIRADILFATDNNGKIDDSLWIAFLPVLKSYYEANDHTPLWSSKEKWKPQAAAFLSYLGKTAEDGLYKEDYHFAAIDSLKRSLDADSLKRMDAVLWTRADLLFTDAFMHIIQDLKQGRLQPDSLAWKNIPAKYQHFFAANLDRFKNGEALDSITRSIQPSIKGYWSLKAGIKTFIDSMDSRRYTYVPYPYKKGEEKDSLAFITKLLLRLSESGIINKNGTTDSLQLASLLKKYQQQKKLNADGKISSSLIRTLNTTDIDRYNRIAITLDRYKQLPDTMPEKYILVNLPGFYLQVWDADTVALTSKVICGKPATSTPFITSAISDLVIFPTWTVPSSIIKKEMLPGLKKNSNYLARKGLHLYNNKGELVDPATVNWAKYSKGIPYKIQQGSGDDNALGVIKFNFNNPFDVYLHDTNQRYLFKNAMRALSHGCVRVQDWEKLAFYIARNDSLKNEKAGADTLKYNTDSITNWIANKERHRIDVKYKIPLFIRYFGCEGINGAIKFYDDIYDEDKKIKEKFFALK